MLWFFDCLHVRDPDRISMLILTRQSLRRKSYFHLISNLDGSNVAQKLWIYMTCFARYTQEKLSRWKIIIIIGWRKEERREREKMVATSRKIEGKKGKNVKWIGIMLRIYRINWFLLVPAVHGDELCARWSLRWLRNHVALTLIKEPGLTPAYQDSQSPPCFLCSFVACIRAFPSPRILRHFRHYKATNVQRRLRENSTLLERLQIKYPVFCARQSLSVNTKLP